MLSLFAFLFVAILLYTVYHDFKYRVLPIYILLAAQLFSVLISVKVNGWENSLYHAFVNLMLLLMQLGFIIGYFSLKNRRLTNICKEQIGWGDILFFAVLIFCFSPLNFILFIIFSSVLVLLIYFKPREKVLIPLAGCQALLLAIVIILSNGIHVLQPYNDRFIIKLFYNGFLG